MIRGSLVLVAALVFSSTMSGQLEPGKTRYVGMIILSGFHHFDSDTLRNTLGYPDEPWTLGTLKADIEQNLKPFLKRHGFLRGVAEIEAVREMVNDQIGVTIHIDEGPQYQLSKVGLTGATAFATQDLPKLFGISQGESVDMVLVEEGLERLVQMYQEAGYIDMDYTQDMKIDEEEDAYDLTISVSEGKRYIVGGIGFHGVVAGTDQALREVSKLEQQYYSHGRLEDTIAAINKLGLYKTLTGDDVKVERRPMWGEVNISINLKPKTP